MPSFRQNLVYVLSLDIFGYCSLFGIGKFSLFQNSNLVGTGSLSGYDNLYLLDSVAHLMNPCM